MSISNFVTNFSTIFYPNLGKNGMFLQTFLTNSVLIRTTTITHAEEKKSLQQERKSQINSIEFWYESVRCVRQIFIRRHVGHLTLSSLGRWKKVTTIIDNFLCNFQKILRNSSNTFYSGKILKLILFKFFQNFDRAGF